MQHLSHLSTFVRCYNADSVNPATFQEILAVGEPQCFPFILSVCLNCCGQLELFSLNLGEFNVFHRSSLSSS